MLELSRIGEISLIFQKIFTYVLKIFVSIVFVFLCAEASVAEERWDTITWSDNAAAVAKFEALSLERDMTSFEVLEANGYFDGELPLEGKELLIPESRSDILATWVEVQSRGGGVRPLVTIQPHDVPAELPELTDAPVQGPIAYAVPEEEELVVSEFATIEALLDNLLGTLEQAELDQPIEVTELAAIEEQPAQYDDAPSQETRASSFTARDLELYIAQNQAPPLVTIRPHEVPGSMRDSPAEERATAAAMPEMYASLPRLATDEQEEPIRNMRIVVSGGEVILRTDDGALIDPDPSTPTLAAVERELLVPLPMREPSIVAPPVYAPQIAAPLEKMMWPVNGRVSSGFGRRGTRRHHDGIDIPMPAGTPILAARDGVVLLTATSRTPGFRGYGNTVKIYHGDGIVTLYAHCSKINVSRGQKVRRGDVIAFVGNTGRTTTNHLHFEVRVNGRPVDPIPFLVLPHSPAPQYHLASK